MIKEYQIRVRPEVAAQEDRLKAYLADEDGLDARTINDIRILKRSIDARQRQIFVNLKVHAYVNEMPTDDVYQHTEYPNVEGKPQVIVVGAGPGGLFAALRLIELGLLSLLLLLAVERSPDSLYPLGFSQSLCVGLFFIQFIQVVIAHKLISASACGLRTAA